MLVTYLLDTLAQGQRWIRMALKRINITFGNLFKNFVFIPLGSNWMWTTQSPEPRLKLTNEVREWGTNLALQLSRKFSDMKKTWTGSSWTGLSIMSTSRRHFFIYLSCHSNKPTALQLIHRLMANSSKFWERGLTSINRINPV